MIKDTYIQERDALNPHYKRQMHSKNVLLLKPELGRSKPTTMNLPNEQFVYGKQLAHDTEGAGKVISIWKLPVLSQEQIRKKDFAKYNKLALTRKIITPRSVYKFRKEKDVRIKKIDNLNLSVKPQIPRDKIFGQPTRATTPIETIINFNYGREGEQMMKQKYIRTQSVVTFQFQKHKRRQPSKTWQDIVQQRTQQQKSKENSSNAKTSPINFKMRKFLKTQAKIKFLDHQSNLNNTLPCIIPQALKQKF